MPNSWGLALNIIEWTHLILLMAVVVSGSLYLYAYFFTEDKLGWGDYYFWWLVAALILVILIGYLVLANAPMSCPSSPETYRAYTP